MGIGMTTGGADARSLNHTPEITLVLVAPLANSVGYPIHMSATVNDLDGDPLKTRWIAVFNGGVIADRDARDTTYTCAIPGDDVLTFLVSDGERQRSQSVQVACW